MVYGEMLPSKVPAPTTKTLGAKRKARSVSTETHERRNDSPVVRQTTATRASSSPESRTSPAKHASQRQTTLTLLVLEPCAPESLSMDPLESLYRSCT